MSEALAASGGSVMVHRELAAATHPAVIWSSHLLDITPAQWPSYKACFHLASSKRIVLIGAKFAAMEPY